MGLLVDGVWQEDWYDTERTGGRFERPETRFRDWVTADGRSGFPAEPGRYHLHVSLACPWAHRTLILRHLKGLEDVIDVSVVDPYMGEGGWHFSNYPGASEDRVNGCRYLHQVYLKARPDYTGRVTVPTLWDKVAGTIVNNESAEIVRMLNSAFDAFGRADRDFYPAALREQIDRVNAFVYDRINNGVYKAGFATRQDAYEEAVGALFAALDELEERLSRQPYLAGDRVTEADWRLFTTLVRFDPVYVGHFKCNVRRLVDYPNLWAYTRQLYQVERVAETVNLDHIKRHYFTSHPMINPTRIIPAGPAVDYSIPHDRGPVPL
ncbi:glutathione S-transferase family protein [Alkalilimnicola ehrlichii MLHE-1]|uniref:Glutathione S-transferase-like protein n=1 Tax=Alkalilimnicola ehrlichii (strain ATCC BAA-1101 / DSM 17681 / MLHE-1) TaxID=187272 RepID=Q0A962_ALKEH|nr:glutathione S-transferase family protein [Alkalilimnicola ehrlichii]ABI56625.1 Glutathione S-transferase-like protein [Alkalilimnicola ehrlichii MLHE-1]